MYVNIDLNPVRKKRCSADNRVSCGTLSPAFDVRGRPSFSWDARLLRLYSNTTCERVYNVGETIRIDKTEPTPGGFRLWISTLDEPLVVPAALYHQHRLKAGIVITEPQLQQLRAEAEKLRCEATVARMLGRREHSVGEVRAKLS